MNLPIEISFRGLQKTDALDQLIREKVQKLERFCDHIVSCRVAVEKPAEEGRPFRVRLDIRLPPGKEVVVKREFDGDESVENLPKVLREAFDVASRQIKEAMDKLSGH